MLGFVLTATPQCLEIYCVWRESGHFSLLHPSLKAQRNAQKSNSWTEIWKDGLHICFCLTERLSLMHRELLWSSPIRPILGHNPAARLTDTRTIRPRKRKTFAQAGVLKHPFLLLQEHLIPDFTLTHRQQKMRERHRSGSWKFHQKETKGMWISSYTAAVYSRASWCDPRSMALPITRCTEGSGCLGADSWALLSPLLQGHASLEEDRVSSYGDQSQPATMACQHLWIIQKAAPALPKHFCISRLTLHFCQGQSILQPSGITVQVASPRRPIPSLGVHFCWEGWRGQSGTGLDKEAEVDHPVGSGVKLPGLWPELEKILRVCIPMITLPSMCMMACRISTHVQDLTLY